MGGNLKYVIASGLLHTVLYIIVHIYYIYTYIYEHNDKGQMSMTKVQTFYGS